ncbi:MAG TPA: PAS domain S-box protein [Sphingomicrobium sp.]|nr:PAS domain S-box protein [Sphingomicrobium sp.]
MSDILPRMGGNGDHARTPHRTSEAHLRSILATVPDAMVVIDERGIILSFSAAAEKMFGYSEAEVVGENVSMLMPSPDRERHDGYLAHYRGTGERKIIGIGRVTNARRRDGNTFPIELSIGEASVDDQRIFTGFIHDITQRQQAEAQLKDLQAELAHVGRISEMATLASSLAHELNQPLTAVTSYCQSIRRLAQGNADASTRELIAEAADEAASEALRAGEIVRRLRDFFGRGETERHIEELPRLITEANALALVGSRELGVEVQVALDPEAELVLADRVQIQQVLINLIRNALDAMLEADERLLTISTTTEADDLVTIAVQDTGTGISASVADHLFQPFVTSKQTGMGIGLSICRTIIEAHGGRIWFEAAPEGGTIFRFTLPRVEEESHARR